MARIFAVSAAIALHVVSVAGAGLLDNPIIGDATQSLDGEGWIVSNGTIVVGARVPGDLLTDLQLGGIIGDPLYELNFKTPVWDTSNWTYTQSFDLNPGLSLTGGTILLVLDGTKMVADVGLNGQPVGYTADQFLRYSFDVTHMLQKTGNVLTLTFPTSADDRNNEERWMSCSGGWDWAPYSADSQQYKGARTFSKGIWKSVYLVGVAPGATAIEHIAPRVYYSGAYPTAPLSDAAHGDFFVNVSVHFNAPVATSGTLVVSGSWVGTGASTSLPVTLPAGASSVSATITAVNNAVNLWWPANMPAGGQALYPVSVTFTPAGGMPISDSRRIGFRVFTLVTGNDTDPSTLAGRDGNDHHTMRFKVNGANIWSRGANMIPMEEMEGRSSAEAHRRLVQSSVEAGFNTFRLWGGGIFQYDAWYDACDEMGMLIYHDSMFAQGNHAPSNTPMQTAEILHQVRRLSHHPSVAIWDGCNECDGHGIYATFVMTTIAGEDTSRPPWPSCPANGWTSGVDMLTSLPNGSPLGMQPRTTHNANGSPEAVLAGNCTIVPQMDYAQGDMGPLPNVPATSSADCCAQCGAYTGCWAAVFTGSQCWFKNQSQAARPVYNSGTTGCWPNGHVPPPPPPYVPGCASNLPYETHGYYQHGEGFPSVNSGGSLQPFSPNSPPQFSAPATNGPACQGTYASEFGGVASSSFESMAPTLQPSHWGLHAPPMSERNYAVDNFITSYTAIPWPSAFDGAIGEATFKKQLYFAMLGQALWVKSDIEGRRSANSYGCITWQLNEIWPTGGWGSLEYGTIGYTPGQVEGGRWKPLQYFFKRFIYRDHLVALGSSPSSNGAQILVKNDDPFSPFNGTATLSFLHTATGVTTVGSVYTVSLPAGAGQTYFSCVNASEINIVACSAWPAVLPTYGCAANGTDCIALLSLTSAANAAQVAENFVLLSTFDQMTLPTAKVTFAVGAPAADGTVLITLTSNGVALFVTLTTLAQGRFSDNAVILTAGSTVLSFIPWGSQDQYGTLVDTLRVEHVMGYGVTA